MPTREQALEDRIDQIEDRRIEAVSPADADARADAEWAAHEATYWPTRHWPV